MNQQQKTYTYNYEMVSASATLLVINRSHSQFLVGLRSQFADTYPELFRKKFCQKL